MKRFIRYLYEYEQEKRIRNVGFIKVETGNEETVVHLQVKGFHNREQQLVLCLFFEEDGKLQGIPYEKHTFATPTFSYHLMYKRDDEKLKDIYDKINGILIEMENGKRIAATWDDKSVDVSQLVEYEEPEDMVEELVEEEKEPQNSIKLTKISRQDISKFPRCEWKLANNKFLVHGYENFHHLLLIDNGKDLKLGVPGIYHIKEAACAEIFGFEGFLTAEELGIVPDSEEEMFGYWCRSVRKYQKS